MKLYKIILINSLVLGVFVLAIEISLGIVIGIRRLAGIGGENPYKLQFQISGTTGHKHYLINKEWETGYDRQEEDYAIKNFKNNSNNKSIKIITLGGSSTDPYGLKYAAKGGTWPELLGESLKAKNQESNIDIINYGQGGFTSSQEFLSLLKASSTFPANYAVSLTGINEVYFVRNLTNGYISDTGSIYKSELTLKAIKKKQPIIIFNNQRFRKCEWFCIDLLPKYNSNIKRFLDFINTKKLSKQKYTIGNENLKKDNIKNWENEKLFKSVGDIFKRNLINSYLIAKENGIEYIAFLQPTMRINDINEVYNSDAKIIDYLNEKYPNEATNTKRRLSHEVSYLYDISKLYFELKKRCEKLDFCYDISEILDNNENQLYSDRRHNNEKGNKIIAQKISTIIQSKIKK
ncbi:SGNH/GDSL hydrolase family protein [Prochlorococcus sp. MIT 1011]|uniref:SGNH/GDSL hydrolase family protein n=1 Tax=Prochlorococcus sp. MIT 1011 TaxID=3082520 RepID=UPI0039B600BA